MDAVLGAMGAPDIGHLFPDKDERYRGISSMKLTEEVAGRMRGAGYAVGNIDITVIAQRPKLAPYLDEMKNNIAHAFSCDISAVNIKATTEEGLGFTGEGQGIAAHAVCLLVSP
jgi:2-C-methyl-D-erythritol 2,4-cyclodiphosphate synthase